jgi:hypothetical protein
VSELGPSMRPGIPHQGRECSHAFVLSWPEAELSVGEGRLQRGQGGHSRDLGGSGCPTSSQVLPLFPHLSKML